MREDDQQLVEDLVLRKRKTQSKDSTIFSFRTISSTIFMFYRSLMMFQIFIMF